MSMRPIRRARRRRAAGVLALSWPLLTGPSLGGCYVTRPLAPPQLSPGMPLVLGVSDRGRVALGATLGPGVERIAGTLASRTDSALVLHVSAVEYRSGERSRWGGERLTVGHDAVARMDERRLSRSRSWLAAGVAVAASVAFLTTVRLVAGGSEDGGTKLPPGPGPSQ
jgi:hypothetical protein